MVPSRVLARATKRMCEHRLRVHRNVRCLKTKAGDSELDWETDESAEPGALKKSVPAVKSELILRQTGALVPIKYLPDTNTRDCMLSALAVSSDPIILREREHGITVVPPSPDEMAQMGKSHKALKLITGNTLLEMQKKAPELVEQYLEDGQLQIISRFEDEMIEAEELSTYFIRFGGAFPRSSRAQYELVKAQERILVGKPLEVRDPLDGAERDDVKQMLHEPNVKLSDIGPPPNVPGYWQDPETVVDYRYWLHAGLRVDGKHCPGCGVKFQSHDRTKLGFIDREKLILFPVLKEQEKSPVLCVRCSDSKTYHRVDNYLTVHGAKESGLDLPELRPGEAEKTLMGLRGKRCVFLYIVDATDLSGSFFNLHDFVGDNNPVVIGLNKCDLLPRGFSVERVKQWCRDEFQRRGMPEAYDIHILSNRLGNNHRKMLSQLYSLARHGGCDIHVVGATNVGKSSIINHLLDLGWAISKRPIERRNLRLTTSFLPATTVAAVPVATGDGLKIYDTPGIIMQDNIQSYLTPAELSYVVGNRQLESFNSRFAPGQTILFGGLARMDCLEGDVSLASWFCSGGVRVHRRDTEGVEDFLYANAGTEVLYPPIGFDDDYDQRWEWTSKEIEIRGGTWKHGAADVVISGLGWMCFTVTGSTKIRVVVPRGVRIFKRPPLLPYQAVQGAARFTGTRWVNRYSERRARKEKNIIRNLRDQGKLEAPENWPNYEDIQLRKWRGFIQ